MNEIICLIRQTHPVALDNVITANLEGTNEDSEDALGNLLSVLYVDDTFNEYSEEQLTAAIESEVESEGAGY